MQTWSRITPLSRIDVNSDKATAEASFTWRTVKIRSTSSVVDFIWITNIQFSQRIDSNTSQAECVWSTCSLWIENLLFLSHVWGAAGICYKHCLYNFQLNVFAKSKAVVKVIQFYWEPARRWVPFLKSWERKHFCLLIVI